MSMKASSRVSCSAWSPACWPCGRGQCHPTAEGVGRATTRTVVITAIAVLILDFMITAVFL
ncbi:MAG: ABC transporter permease [Woeseiaceae bacterium]|nr:ABC transporter permease [Woeseiaceae bacterium]